MPAEPDPPIHDIDYRLEELEREDAICMRQGWAPGGKTRNRTEARHRAGVTLQFSPT